MDDQITDLANLEANLTIFNEELAKIETAMFTGNTLETTKQQFQKSWESANAAKFLGDYDKFVQCMTDARTSITRYNQRLTDVKNRFVAFDNTIKEQQGE